MCKVRVVYQNDTLGDTVVYRGLINEEATKLDASKETISFRVLSRDSVLKKTKISGGLIASGVLASAAIASIFSDSTISMVLTLDPLDVDLPYDFIVDDGSAFDNKSSRQALNDILRASGAVLLIDDDGNVSVRGRTQNSDTAILNLYGPYDIHRRQNTVQLKDYNSGLHRMFTSITINDTQVDNTAYIQTFGFRDKSITFDFITDPIQEDDIATLILDEFKSPKKECVVEVPISTARGVQLLDRVSLNWPLRITPYDTGFFMPIIGSTKIGESAMPLPNTYGSIAISPQIAFKVIEIQEDPKSFTAFLKLRQIGSSVEDGYFTDDLTGIIGYAVIGISIIGVGGDPDDAFNVSVIGAAKIGATEI